MRLVAQRGRRLCHLQGQYHRVGARRCRGGLENGLTEIVEVRWTVSHQPRQSTPAERVECPREDVADPVGDQQIRISPNENRNLMEGKI